MSEAALAHYHAEVIDMQTVDKAVSPKVYVPLIVNLLIAGALIALGERELGVGMLLAAASGAGLGYMAPPRSNGNSIKP